MAQFTPPSSPRVWLVHDWLTGMRGGEKVLLRLAECFPNAPIATLFFDPTAIDPRLAHRVQATSLLQHIPGIARHYRALLPLFPAAVRTIRIPPCDLVLSISHCVAKGVNIPEGARHLCYCLAPMRYIWEPAELYFGAARSLQRTARDLLAPALRKIDRRQNRRVDAFATTCRNVANRITAHYGTAATVIYPGIDLPLSAAAPPHAPEDFYLIVGAMVPYKRVDLAIAAFLQRPDRKLVIIGRGPRESALRALANNAPNITFCGWQPDDVVHAHYATCRALLFPGEEDFGLVPLEVQAAGRPVIAFGRGGILETVIPFGSSVPPTGVFFTEQTPAALNDAINQYAAHEADFSPAAAQRHAQQFRWENFDASIAAWVTHALTPLPTTPLP